MNEAEVATERARLKARLERLARAAWERGEREAAAGKLEEAERWLERALRLARDEPTVQLMLASIRLRRGDLRAAPVLQALAERFDLRTAWLGLATAHCLADRPQEAEAALHTAFANHAAPADPDINRLADRVAATTGAAGWCFPTPELALVIGGSGDAEVTADGKVRRRIVPGRDGVWRLPPMLRAAARLDVTRGGRPLIGSPVELARIRRIEGFVQACEGGIEGWAWHPANPDAAPLLCLAPGTKRIVAREPADGVRLRAPLARPRGFSIPAARLPEGPVSVTGPDGRHLTGSPLDPGLVQREAATAAAALARRLAAGQRRKVGQPPELSAVPANIRGKAPPGPGKPRGVAVIVPVYGSAALTLACLERVLTTVPAGTRVIVVDDASPDPVLVAALRAEAARGRIELVRNGRNRGFPASANAGLRAAGAADAVLLNSDTIVPPRWLERLRAAAYAAPDIGTAAPFSNDATILSYPRESGGNALPGPAATDRLAILAYRANRDATAEIPTAVGFCMYIRRDCLDSVGPFREDVFAQGYGEENDFCLRARHLGWRHVAALGAFVAHVGGQSFGTAGAYLARRNQDVLETLHPGYARMIAAWRAADPLAPARRGLDAARLCAEPGGPAVLLVTHDRGGGVQKQVEARMAALRAQGRRPLVLRPAMREPEARYDGLCVLDTGFGGEFPNLRFVLPGETAALAKLLRMLRVASAEMHHLLGHDHAVLDLIATLGIPYDMHVHDYAAFCPRIALIGPERRYCGEPAPNACADCVADAGRNIEEEISVAALRFRSAADLRRAANVIAPSHDAGARLARHFPGIAPRVVPWEDDSRLPPPVVPEPATERLVCVVGALGVEKGYDVLLAAARDAAARDLKLRFVLVGHSVDDERLLATGRVFVTGEYADAEAPALIAAQRAALAWLPSIWPETWCFALTQAWRAGLHVAAFDLGAQAERIRRTGRGFLLPLGLPPAAINAALLSWRAPALASATSGFADSTDALNRRTERAARVPSANIVS